MGKYIVSVECMTFNQSQYITDAMNGFIMQQTNFPFVVTVVDDASTDGEQDVIRAYVNEHFDVEDTNVAYEKETDYAYITYAQHKTNKNCYFAVLYLKENHYSQRKSKYPYLSEWRDNVKYIAICEGDDYWIHSQKLQMQVDFLEKNKEYSLCFHNAIITYDDIVKKSEIFCDILQDRDVSLEDIIASWIIPTASIVYRKSVVENYPEWTRSIYSGDFTLQLIAYSKGKLYYINKIMSIYRKTYNSTSVSSAVKKTFPVDYVLRQHIVLFKLYNEYTNYKYNDVLNRRIKFNEKQANFARYKQRCLLYAVFKMPIFSVAKVIGRLRG